MDDRIMNIRNFKTLPDDVVKVDRSTPYGNPFPIGRGQNRQQAIALYRGWLTSQPHLIEQARKELKGKRLACWCAPLPCHAEVILEILDA